MSPVLSVSEIVARVRSHLRRRLGQATGAMAAGAVLLVLAIAWLLAGANGWSTGTPVPLVLDLVAIGLAVGAFIVLRRHFAAGLDDGPLSRTMENAAGLRHGAVLGSMELESVLPPGTSEPLAREAMREASQSLGTDAEPLAGAFGDAVELWRKRALGALVVLAPLVVLLGVVQPQRATSAWGGLARPLKTMLGEPLPSLEITPGSVELMRGAPMQIQVEATGRDVVTLRWRSAGDVPRQDLGVVEDGVATFTFNAVDAEMEYWAEAPDGASTETYSVTLIDPLLVTDVRLSLNFPPHTGRAPEEYVGRIPPLEIPVGTRIGVDGQASRALATAALVLDVEGEEGRTLPLDVNVRAFGSTFVPPRSGRYTWSFTDDDGEPPTVVPEALELSLVADRAPAVRVVYPGADTILPLSRRQPLVIEADDDYGLARLEVVAFLPGDEGRPDVRSIDLGGAPAIEARPVLDASRWELVPGDSVLYRVRAVDVSPAGQVGESRTYVLHIPTVSDVRDAAQDELFEAVERLEDLARRARQETENLRPTEPQSGDREASTNFDQSEDARQTLERQEGLTDDVEALAEELQQLTEALREAGLADEELRADLEELQELLQQALSDELQNQMDQLSESLDDADAQQAMEELQQLLEQQEAFRDQLEQSIDRFKRAAVEQDFRAAAEDAEDLARREQALAEQFKEEQDPSARAEQQEMLEAEAEQLLERMEQLQEQLSELGEQEASEQVQAAQQQASSARQSMSQASQSQSGQQASQQASEAAEAMDEAAQQLQEAQEQMAQEMTDRVKEAFNRAAQDALGLAEQQAGLREEMRGASREELAEMRADQAAVAEGARNLTQNLQEALRFSPLDAPGVTEMAQEAADEAGQTADALDRRGSSTSPAAAADRTVQTLNRLAVRSMSAAQQVEQAANQQAQSSGEQMEQQLDQLAEQQSELMDQSAQMMPMQLSQQAMQQQMQQMAQGQQSVASELGDMANQSGQEEQPLGDLQAMAEEAQAIAEAIEAGRLDRETVQRQQRLFHRLLDAGRTLRKEEEDDSEERESEEPGEFDRTEVSPLDASDLDAVRFRLPSAEYLSRLSPGERALVLRYFERLNRSEVPTSGAVVRPRGGR